MKRFLSKWCWLTLTLAVAAILVGLMVVALHYSETLLTIDDGEVKGDVMVVLGGVPYRANYAAFLYNKGVAPLVLVTGSGDTSANVQILLNGGVPGKMLVVESQALDTYQNATLTIPLLRKIGAHRIVIVTSWYHSRRALACFQHLAPDLVFLSRPYIPPDGEIKIYEQDHAPMEYLKIAEYFLGYGIIPVTK